jgi:hypothetical protein
VKLTTDACHAGKSYDWGKDPLSGPTCVAPAPGNGKVGKFELSAITNTESSVSSNHLGGTSEKSRVTKPTHVGPESGSFPQS